MSSTSRLLVLCAFAACWQCGSNDTDGSPAQTGSPSSPATPGGDTVPAAPPASAAPSTVPATDLFYKTFGKKTDRAVVFLHGGPGGNALMFENSTADALAKRGNYVVTYDQRGSGRSPKGNASDFTYAKVTRDLDDLIHALALTRPILIGHSWGGTLAVKYLDAYPGTARGAILVGNPLDYPDSIFNIHERCTDNYRARLDYKGVDDIAQLHARMFPHGKAPPYSYTNDDANETMGQAMKCGLDTPRIPTPQGLALWSSLLGGADGSKMLEVEPSVGAGYQANEHLLYSEFRALFSKVSPTLYGIYGKEDGLVSDAQVATMTSIMSAPHFKLVDAASHVVFVDRQDEFLAIASADLDALSK